MDFINQQLLYQEEPRVLEFEADIIEQRDLPGGRMGILLDRTYFYPTGGGQEHDIGFLGDAQVVDVYKEGDPFYLVHVVDRKLPPGLTRARIDYPRRLGHMQHHSAQHLLSQCLIRLFEIDSISANINGDTPSTLDLAVPNLTCEQIYQVEELANQVIFADYPIKTYFVTPAQLQALPLRWPAKVAENIRIVEIEGLDYTACGGTHCYSTGMIGMVKIIKTERQNEQTRISFVAGWQAYGFFRQYQNTVQDLAGQMSIHPAELVNTVSRQVELLKSAQKELQILRQERLVYAAHQLADNASPLGDRRIVVQDCTGRPAGELRALASELARIPGVIAVLAALDGQKLSVVTACAIDSGISARDLLAQLLTLVGGRGGGEARLAQGGGAGGPEQVRFLLAQAELFVQKLLA